MAHQVRLEGAEAEGFEKLLARRKAEAVRAGATASAAGLLRAIVRDALIREGLLAEEPEEPKAPARRTGKGSS